MRITGAGNFLPTHVARAYGLPTPALAPAARLNPAQPANAPAAAPVQGLVAAHVPGGVNFDGASVPRPAEGVFHLYTRAADKIEAATAIQIGRSIDVKG